MNGLLKVIADDVMFAVEFLAVVVLLFVVAILIDKLSDKKHGVKGKILTTRMMTVTGMFSAIALVLYLFDFPLLFLAPGFYKVDFSELPVMIGSFAFGPVAGVMIEFCKVVLKVLFQGTNTALVGDLANFVIGCSLLLPASAIYEFVKSKKGAIIGCVVGTLCMTVFGTMFNALYLLPTFVNMGMMPNMEAVIASGSAINPSINSLTGFVCMCVAPLNLLKGTVVSLITMLIYKPLSPIIKEGRIAKTAKVRA